TLFDLMGRYEDVWKGVRGSQDVRVFGLPYAVGLEPVPVKIERLVSLFRQGAAELPPVWKSFLPEDVLRGIQEAAARVPPSLSDELFVRIIYGAAVGYTRKSLPRETLIGSLIPLYLGKVATFVEETREAEAAEAEARLETLARVYEGEKTSLVSAWDGEEDGTNP
ncbi:MAG TPA: hypothetical protein VFZ57_08125, partial [Thermoanaerobaculia bacterium]|nr:hypothetical protein [Thermoanaerobaculia bacterium]